MRKEYFTKILPGNKTTLSVLKNAVIRDGALVASDLDQWLYVRNPYTTDADNNGQVFSLTRLKKTPRFSVTRMVNLDPEDFPDDRVDPESNASVDIPLTVIAHLREFAQYCSTDYASRPSLTGVYLDLEKGVMCATNGHVLRERRFNGQPGGAWILPALAAGFMTAMRWETVESVSISDGYLRLEYATRDGDAVTYRAKLVEGHYPDYEKCIPEDGQETSTGGPILKALADKIRRLREQGNGGDMLDPVIFNQHTATWRGESGHVTTSIHPVFHPAPRQASAKLMLQVLGDLSKAAGVRTLSSENSGCPLIFITDDERFVVMPCNPPEDVAWPYTGEAVE